MDRVGIQELQRLLLARKEEFLRKLSPSTLGVRMSSGTTSGTPLVSLGFHSEEAFMRYKDTSRALIVFGSQQAQAINTLFFMHASGAPSGSVLPIGWPFPPSVGDLIRMHAPDSVFGVPSLIERLLREVGEAPWREDVRILWTGGEALSPLREGQMREAFPNAQFRSDYVATETGVLGHRPCGVLRARQYHPAEGVKFKIADADERGVGDILVSLKNPLMEIVDYRIGDKGRLLQKSCACGEEVTVEVIGRSGVDFVKIPGGIIHRDEVERVVSELSFFVADMRIIVDFRKTGAPQIICKIEPRPTLVSDPQSEEIIAREVARRLFVTPQRVFADLLREGLYGPLLVEYEEVSLGAKEKRVMSIE